MPFPLPPLAQTLLRCKLTTYYTLGLRRLVVLLRTEKLSRCRLRLILLTFLDQTLVRPYFCAFFL